VKEPDYFAPHARRMTWDSYLALFRKPAGRKAVGEASTSYFGSQEAPQLIHEAIPGARIIILLRNPADQAFSFYRYAKMVGRIRHRTFEAALAHDRTVHLEKLSGRQRMYRQAIGYIHRGLYHDPTKRYLDLFGRDRTRVFLFEDMVRDPQSLYSDACRFLGVSPRFTPTFTVENRSRFPRSATLQWLFGRFSRHVPPARLPIRALRRVNVWLGGRGERLSREVRTRLVGEFRQDIERLSELINRDLGMWLRTDA